MDSETSAADIDLSDDVTPTHILWPSARSKGIRGQVLRELC